MTVTLDFETAGESSSTRRALTDISLAVAKCKKIVVVTGAGISCSCGIPDFRSSDGLYALVKQRYPDVVLKGRDLFDAALFRDPTSTAVFYTFISQLKRSIDDADPAPTHKFIRTLDAKKKLLRSYTQNIDGLESKVGLVGSSSQEAKTVGKGKTKIKAREVRNVQLHGDIHRVRCTFCCAEFPCSEEYLDQFGKGNAPDCPECFARSKARVARSARALRIGTLRPAIVLYDEPHPLGDEIGTIQLADVARKPDMLIIMGTSMKVHGLKKLVKDFARAVHETSDSPKSSPKSAKPWTGKVVFVNKTAPGSEWSDVIDYHVTAETDKWAAKVIEDWKKMRPSDWEVQQTLDMEVESGAFKISKNVASAAKLKSKATAGKDKCKTGVENIPPDDDFFASSPIQVCAKATAPSSPSKRRQTTSHYSDVESSPSKKRDVTSVSDRLHKMTMEERGLLFTDATNLPASEDADPFDLTTTEKIIRPMPRRTRAEPVSTVAATRSKSVGRKPIEVAIETRSRKR